ncbi:radical SAM protein [Pseudoalteromonas rubra]|uniref:Radical SAM protein n=1 Tax=Pseudoalteromonas rubra TaxID=43658 RepID=A0A5S3WNT9_9GAMM|nr:radical SAM protein [Pseudoalteromonas rubra]TMP29008.1 radical SAM protein [Pseudoalteromonas rubra]TMP29192.1 radical SAM protein [Pseudoalteromonas rubra]
MDVELRPLGVKCNIACQYCYQNPQRDAGNLTKDYDLNAMKQAILEEGADSFTLFGGEALMVPEADLASLWQWGFEQFGHNAVQTNGTLINANHIRLFKKFNVHVGISIDGPGILNDVRWAGSLKKTRALTQKTESAIYRLCQEGLAPSIIVTLHRNNATQDKLATMREWFFRLDNMGIRKVRLHLLESDNELVRQKYVLNERENLTALNFFLDLEQELSAISLDIFSEVTKLLTGQDSKTSCVWRACDPYTTNAVRGVEGFGQSSNCGRTNKDGIDFVKSEQPGYERYIALFHTPQANGGCQGCRFFSMCKGQCPGTSINGDWRNRTEYCAVWFKIFEKLEQQLLDAGKDPLSLSSKRSEIEAFYLEAWANRQNPSIEYILYLMQQKEGVNNAT